MFDPLTLTSFLLSCLRPASHNDFSFFFHHTPPFRQEGCGALRGSGSSLTQEEKSVKTVAKSRCLGKNVKTRKYHTRQCSLEVFAQSPATYCPMTSRARCGFLEVALMLWNTQAGQERQITAPTPHLQYLLTHRPVFHSTIIALLTFWHIDSCLIFNCAFAFVPITPVYTAIGHFFSTVINISLDPKGEKNLHHYLHQSVALLFSPLT